MLTSPALHLETEEGATERLRFMIGPQGGTVGSADGNTVLLPASCVRRVHARILFTEGKPVLFRLHPEASVRVNGEESEVVTLKPGDLVQFGDAAPLRVRYQGGLSAEETPATLLSHLCHATAAIDGSREIDEVLARICDAALAIIGADRGFVIRMRDGRLAYDTVRIQRRPGVEWTPATFSRTVVEEALTQDGPVLRSYGSPLADRPHSVALSSIGSALACALNTPLGPLGVLYLDSHGERGKFTERDHTLLALFSNIAALAVAQSERSRKLAESYLGLQAARRLVDFSPHPLFVLEGTRVAYENPASASGPLAGVPQAAADALASMGEPMGDGAAARVAQLMVPVLRRAGRARRPARERVTVEIEGKERVFEIRAHLAGQAMLAVSVEDVTQGHEDE